MKTNSFTVIAEAENGVMEVKTFESFISAAEEYHDAVYDPHTISTSIHMNGMLLDETKFEIVSKYNELDSLLSNGIY